MTLVVVLRGLPNHQIEKIINHYKVYTPPTYPMIQDIGKTDDSEKLSELYKEFQIVSERYVMKLESKYPIEIIFRSLVWYIYDKFVMKMDILKK